jgi:hypothetical protein
MAVAGYSIYVAVHQPDPQETILLGQTKIAAGNPAALHISVRNRITGKPIERAIVEFSLVGTTAGTIKLGTFRSDASGSITDGIAIPDVAPGDYSKCLKSAQSRQSGWSFSGRRKFPLNSSRPHSPHRVSRRKMNTTISFEPALELPAPDSGSLPSAMRWMIPPTPLGEQQE